MEKVKLEIGDVLAISQDNLNTTYNYIYKDSKKVQEIVKQLVKMFQGLILGNTQKNIADIYFDPQPIQKTIQETSNKLNIKKYVIQFIYVGGGYVLIQERSGVHLYKVPMTFLIETDIFRIDTSEFDETDFKKLENFKSLIKDIVKKYWNNEYDYSNNIVDQFPGIVKPILNFDTPEKVNGTELIQRMYNEQGIELTKHNDFENVNLDDLLENKFVKLF